MTTTRFVPLTLKVSRDGTLFAALCEELNVGSQGETVDEALQNAREAVAVHLETLVELGRWQAVSTERGLDTVAEPAQRAIQVTLGPDEVIESYFAPLPGDAVAA